MARGSPGPAVPPSPSPAHLSPSGLSHGPQPPVPLIPWSELGDVLGKVENSPSPSAVPPWFLNAGEQTPPQGMDTGGPGIEPPSSEGVTSAHCLDGRGARGKHCRSSQATDGERRPSQAPGTKQATPHTLVTLS